MEISYTLMSGTQTIHDYIPKVSFVYDDDGNMLNDEQGQQLIYDSQNRLTRVMAGNGLSVNQYDYDGHDHLTATTQGGEAATLRFYEGDRLSNTVQGPVMTQYLNDGDSPLGQQRVGDTASKALLLMSNANSSVIGEIQQSELRTAVYNAYGERSGDDELHSLLAFNGEVRDPSCGWYLLGKGYRAYNPELMRFHSPDSMSPFGAGGLNPYGYCIGNPIAFQDPTGHSVGQLYHNQHETNKLAIALTWGAAAMGVAFSVASFGSLSPVMMVVVGVSIATDIASAGLIHAGLETSDPEKADKLVQSGYALSMGNVMVGFAGMGKSALKAASRKGSTASLASADTASMITIGDNFMRRRLADLGGGPPPGSSTPLTPVGRGLKRSLSADSTGSSVAPATRRNSSFTTRPGRSNPTPPADSPPSPNVSRRTSIEPDYNTPPTTDRSYLDIAREQELLGNANASRTRKTGIDNPPK